MPIFSVEESFRKGAIVEAVKAIKKNPDVRVSDTELKQYLMRNGFVKDEARAAVTLLYEMNLLKKEPRKRKSRAKATQVKKLPYEKPAIIGGRKFKLGEIFGKQMRSYSEIELFQMAGRKQRPPKLYFKEEVNQLIELYGQYLQRIENEINSRKKGGFKIGEFERTKETIQNYVSFLQRYVK